MFGTAKAKLVKNKKLNTVRLIVAFNVFEKRKQFNSEVWKFPVQSKCDYVSGDISEDDVLRTLENAKQAIRADEIVLVA